MEREHGFQDEIRRRYPEMDVVGLQFGMADRAKAMAVTENVLSAHPDLAGLFADNESSTSGAVQALKARGARQVKMVAFDASEQIVADVRDGWIDALVVQNPFKMGYESTRAIGRKLRGETSPRTLDSGAALVTRGDLDQPAIRELLFPEIRKYLEGDGR
jgi:ribose transport system substrate-binding protein